MARTRRSLRLLVEADGVAVARQPPEPLDPALAEPDGVVRPLRVFVPAVEHHGLDALGRRLAPDAQLDGRVVALVGRDAVGAVEVELAAPRDGELLPVVPVRV